MRRLIARILLVLLLVGVMAPAGLAFSAQPTCPCCHGKCCRRMMQKMRRARASHGPAARAAACCGHACNCWLGTTQYAHPQSPVSTLSALASASLVSSSGGARSASQPDSAHSGRAPPAFSFA